MRASLSATVNIAQTETVRLCPVLSIVIPAGEAATMGQGSQRSRNLAATSLSAVRDQSYSAPPQAAPPIVEMNRILPLGDGISSHLPDFHSGSSCIVYAVKKNHEPVFVDVLIHCLSSPLPISVIVDDQDAPDRQFRIEIY